MSAKRPLFALQINQSPKAGGYETSSAATRPKFAMRVASTLGKAISDTSLHETKSLIEGVEDGFKKESSSSIRQLLVQ